VEASELYRRQVALLVRILPFVAEEDCFAVKGGAAINLFIRDLPRLSVDIDLTYLRVANRAKSLAAIDDAMKRIAELISDGLSQTRVHFGTTATEHVVNKLIVQATDVQVKIEVSPVTRGCVYEPVMRTVSSRVEEKFGFAESLVVSFADLYAGKLVATLDRQHPRDLFDVRDLLANEGIDDNLRSAFIVYLLSHNRPMTEVLSPTRKDISQEYERGFKRMTEIPVALDELIETRERLIAEIVGNMPQHHKELLISFKAGTPDWSLLDVRDAQHLPAVRWRMENLDKLGKARRVKLLSSLRAVLT
jgi:predicted nucleotidyltransferase component of viral defense system